MAVLPAACAAPALSPLSVTPVPRLDNWVVAGDTVYGSSAYSEDDWFRVFDFSTRSELRELGSWDVERGGPIALVGSWALVAAGASGLLSFDVSDPSRLSEPRALDLDPGLPFVIRAQSSVALVATLEYVQVFDVSAPGTPRALSRLPIADVSGADWDGSRAYLLSSPVQVPRIVSLHVVDLTDPVAPVTLSTTVAPLSDASRVVAAGDRVFVQSSDKILAYDVSDPMQPRLDATIATLPASDALTVRGNILFASGGRGLSIIDISRIDQPRELASYAGIVDKPVFVEGDRIYALDAQVGGLVTLDLSRACPTR